MAETKENLLLSPTREKQMKRIPSLFVWEDPKHHGSLQLLNFLLDVLKHTEGRDKFTKLLQYGSLSASGFFQLINKFEAALIFKNLYCRPVLIQLDSRMLESFWDSSSGPLSTIELSTSLRTVQKMLLTLTCSWVVKFDPVISIRLLLSSYWVLDNIDTLRKLRILKSEQGNMERSGRLFWIGALILHIWLDLRVISRSNYKIEYIKSQLEL